MIGNYYYILQFISTFLNSRSRSDKALLEEVIHCDWVEVQFFGLCLFVCDL